MEELTERILPSASAMNSLPIISLASPPPVPSVASVTSYVASTMSQWSHFITTVQQDLLAAWKALGQELAQEVSAVQQQWDHLIGINPNAPNPSLNTAVTHPGSDSGAGRGNSSGSGSGKGAMTTANNSRNQQLNDSTQQTGRGSGSGSTSATATHPIALMHGMRVHPLTSGTASGSATVYGNVWLDSDYDGNVDNGELGYSGATVDLLVKNPDGSYTVGWSTTTDGNGDYQFTVEEDPYGHNYEVQVEFPWNFFATKPGYSQIDTNGYTTAFHLAAGGMVQKNAGIASMNVNTIQDDANNAKIQDKVTLRDAIQTGNNGPPRPAVTFYTAPNTALTGTINLQAALDAIKTGYNINGSGASTLTVNGNNAAGTIFTVNAGVTSTISGLTIQGGFNTLGGGIYNSGTLTLQNDVIQDNTATSNGGGIDNAPDASMTLQSDTIQFNNAKNGGGIINSGSLKSYNPGNLYIIANTATGSGGGIYNNGTVNLDNTTISGNTADTTSGMGGGVYNGLTSSISFTLVAGSIANNDAFQGGGLYNGKSATLQSTNVQGNSANQGGGLALGSKSSTTLNTVTVGGNNLIGVNPKAKGIGYITGATWNFNQVTDSDDLDGQPVKLG